MLLYGSSTIFSVSCLKMDKLRRQTLAAQYNYRKNETNEPYSYSTSLAQGFGNQQIMD
jgi:hypothetical protein